MDFVRNSRPVTGGLLFSRDPTRNPIRKPPHGFEPELRSLFRQLGSGFRRTLGHLLQPGHKHAAARRPGPDNAEPDVRPADAQFHGDAGRSRLRDPRRERRHREARPVPLVPTGGPSEHRRAEQIRSRPQGASHRFLPQR